MTALHSQSCREQRRRACASSSSSAVTAATGTGASAPASAGAAGASLGRRAASRRVKRCARLRPPGASASSFSRSLRISSGILSSKLPCTASAPSQPASSTCIAGAQAGLHTTGCMSSGKPHVRWRAVSFLTPSRTGSCLAANSSGSALISGCGGTTLGPNSLRGQLCVSS